VKLYFIKKILIFISVFFFILYLQKSKGTATATTSSNEKGNTDHAMSGQFVPKHFFPPKHPALLWWRCITKNNAEKKKGLNDQPVKGLKVKKFGCSGPGPEHSWPERP
jgi:hypothetical protein